MIDKLKETVHDNKAETLFCKRPGLNNPKNYVVTHIRFFIYLVLVFSDSNKAQVYKIPHRDSPNHEIEVLMSFIYLKLFEPFEHT